MKQLLSRLAANDWLQPRLTWRCALLVPFSLLFGIVVTVRRRAFRCGLAKSTRLAAPVIVVGNIVMGGAGKTPLVIWLVEQLRARGWQPGVISRGYGGSFDGRPQPVDGHSDSALCGDEPVLIAIRTAAPVMIAHDRVAAGLALLAAYPHVNVIIADDGLQHYALQRAAEIVVFDERGTGNGWLFPAGPLRERPARVRAASACVLPAADSANLAAVPTVPQFTRILCPGLPYTLSDRLKTRDWRAFSGNCLALAGIAHPPRFAQMLAQQGIPAMLHAFPDHHLYTTADLDALPRNATVLMTEKDFVKLRGFANHPALADAWVVPLDLELAGKGTADLATLIVNILNHLNTPERRPSHGPKTA